MNRLLFYFNRSLMGYFYHRCKQKWFTPASVPLPAQVDHYGITLQIDCIPKGMQEIIRYGNYEFPEIKVLPSLISPSDQVLEIGAAIGFVGLYCRKILKVKDIVSVEPNPTTLSYLRRNYELNGFTPSIIEAALTEIDGPVVFHVSDMFWCDALIERSETNLSKPITVQGLTFESIAKQAGIKFNMLIIDIEGAEQYLPICSLPDHVKKIVIEIHPELIGVRKAYTVLETLMRSGFNVKDHCHNSWALLRD